MARLIVCCFALREPWLITFSSLARTRTTPKSWPEWNSASHRRSGAYARTASSGSGRGEALVLGSLSSDMFRNPGHSSSLVPHDALSRLPLGCEVICQRSIGQTIFPCGSDADLIRSKRERLFEPSDEVSHVFGHGPNPTLRSKRQINPFVGQATTR